MTLTDGWSQHMKESQLCCGLLLNAAGVLSGRCSLHYKLGQRHINVCQRNNVGRWASNEFIMSPLSHIAHTLALYNAGSHLPFILHTHRHTLTLPFLPWRYSR